MLDLKRVKTLNFEMKDRVQLLEIRLHEALQREMSLQNQLKVAKRSGSDLVFADPMNDIVYLSAASSSSEVLLNETFNSLKYQTEIINKSESTYESQIASTPLLSSHGAMLVNESSVIDEEGITSHSSQSLQFKALKRKCQYLERLTSSYLERINYLEKNAFEQEKHTLFKNSEEDKQLRFLSPLTLKTSKIQESNSAEIEVSRISGTNPIFDDKVTKGALKVKLASESVDYAQLISRVHPSIKEDVEKYIDQVVEERRTVDKKTIRQLLDEIKTLNTKICSVEEFGNFIHLDFDRSVHDIKEMDSVVDDSKVRNTLRLVPSDKKENVVALKKKEPKQIANDNKNDSNKFALLLSFLLGCLVMLLCIFLDSFRNLRRIEDGTVSSFIQGTTT